MARWTCRKCRRALLLLRLLESTIARILEDEQIRSDYRLLGGKGHNILNLLYILLGGVLLSRTVCNRGGNRFLFICSSFSCVLFGTGFEPFHQLLGLRVMTWSAKSSDIVQVTQASPFSYSTASQTTPSQNAVPRGPRLLLKDQILRDMVGLPKVSGLDFLQILPIVVGGSEALLL